MNATIVEKVHSWVAHTARSSFIPPAHLTLFLAVIRLAIWKVIAFILFSCNRAAGLVRIYTGPFHGLITLAAYLYVIYTAGQWIVGHVARAESGRKGASVSSRKGAKVNAKVNGGTVKSGTDKGIVAMCYTNGVFDHAKAARYMEDIDQALRLNTVLDHLMNPDLQKNLEGIRADTPVREFQTTFDTIKRRTGELAGL